jgi:hypothetical protein
LLNERRVNTHFEATSLPDVAIVNPEEARRRARIFFWKFTRSPGGAKPILIAAASKMTALF